MRRALTLALACLLEATACSRRGSAPSLPASSAPVSDAGAPGSTADAVSVDGDAFALSIDPARGGLPVRIAVFDGDVMQSLAGSDGVPAIEVALERGGRSFSTRLATAVLDGPRRDGETTVLSATVTPRDAVGSAPAPMQLRYESHASGAVFLTVDDGLVASGLDGGASELVITLTMDRAAVASGHYREALFASAGPPSLRVAYGAPGAAIFTNELEVMPERGRASTPAAVTLGPGRFSWRIPAGAPIRVALGFGRSVDGPPRSNLAGHRVVQWVNQADPARLGASWYPSDDEIDAIAAAGATVLDLHAMWMAAPGSNGDPHADYTRPRDPEALARTIAHAHARGLRVGLYLRGIERYALSSPVFGAFLEPGRDGVYLDWNGAQAISWHEQHRAPDATVGDVHLSTDGARLAAQAYFSFVQSLRAVVGPSGFILGHQGTFKSGVLANVGLDGLVVGEAETDHGMLATPEEAAYAGVLGGTLALPWPVNAPEAFTTPEGIARMAALGIVPVVPLGIQTTTLFPTDLGATVNGYALHYFRLLAAGHAESSVRFVPAAAPAPLSASDPAARGVVYRSLAPDGTLVVISNLGDRTIAPTITLDTARLGLTGTYRLSTLDPRTSLETEAGTTTGTSMPLPALGPWEVAGLLLRR